MHHGPTAFLRPKFGCINIKPQTMSYALSQLKDDTINLIVSNWIRKTEFIQNRVFSMAHISPIISKYAQTLHVGLIRNSENELFSCTLNVQDLTKPFFMNPTPVDPFQDSTILYALDRRPGYPSQFLMTLETGEQFQNIIFDIETNQVIKAFEKSNQKTFRYFFSADVVVESKLTSTQFLIYSIFEEGNVTSVARPPSSYFRSVISDDLFYCTSYMRSRIYLVSLDEQKEPIEIEIPMERGHGIGLAGSGIVWENKIVLVRSFRGGTPMIFVYDLIENIWIEKFKIELSERYYRVCNYCGDLLLVNVPEKEGKTEVWVWDRQDETWKRSEFVSVEFGGDLKLVSI